MAGQSWGYRTTASLIVRGLAQFFSVAKKHCNVVSSWALGLIGWIRLLWQDSVARTATQPRARPVSPNGWKLTESPITELSTAPRSGTLKCTQFVLSHLWS